MRGHGYPAVSEMVGGWVVLQMVCGDSLTQDRDAIDCCDCDVVSRICCVVARLMRL